VSSPSREQLAAWRTFLTCAFALIDILDAELREESDLSLRWYDVLVQLEEAEHPVRMNELASRILASKSGLTRVVDRMEEAGLTSGRSGRRGSADQRPQSGSPAERFVEPVTRPRLFSHTFIS
jgi:predicted transcriptional regulator